MPVASLSGALGLAGGLGHSAAVKGDGTVCAWGLNGYGQLGDGSTTMRPTPVQVSGITDATAIAAGIFHTLVLRANGTVWGWGSNLGGQLGNGTTTSSSLPVPATGMSNITAIACGAEHSLALNSDGTVWAWGWNVYGQLGDGTTTDKTTPAQIPDLSDVTAVAAGFGHSLALKSDGSVWAWGWNGYGQLGDGSITDRTTPVQISDPAEVIFTAIAAGSNHSIALWEGGYVYAWGNNAYFQTGDSNPAYNDTPVTVSGISGVTVISAGGDHTLAIRDDGTLWTWGSNESGELGNGARKYVPGQVVGPRSQGFLNLLGQEPALHTLTIDLAGNGQVLSTPAGITCGADCAQDYAEGTQIALNATPDPGKVFSGWSGACTGTSPCQITMTTDTAVTATFSTAPQDSHRLIITKAGNGTVTSSPEGIDCGGLCSGYYAQDTEMTLTAIPDFGWLFFDWSGACTGTGPCQVIMNQETTIFAAFESGTPIAAFTGAPLSGSAPLTVKFTDQSTGTVTSWEWAFGDDNATSTEQNPSHTYHNPATYTVSLTVSGPYGSDTEVKDGYVTVYTAGVVYIAPDGTCSDHNPCYKTIQEGINAAADKATIKITEGDYNEALTLGEPKDLKLEGGWDASFTTQTSNSGIRSMMIRSGTVVTRNLVIR